MTGNAIWIYMRVAAKGQYMNKGNKKNTLASPIISVVVPVYKEERSIRPFLSRLEFVMSKMGVSYEVIFSLDPSPDRTEEIILEEINRNPAIKLLVFSRRFGQPAATMAGILWAKGDTCVTIDVDLQDQLSMALQTEWSRDS